MKKKKKEAKPKKPKLNDIVEFMDGSVGKIIEIKKGIALVEFGLNKSYNIRLDNLKVL